jgi:hypothetical protein
MNFFDGGAVVTKSAGKLSSVPRVAILELVVREPTIEICIAFLAFDAFPSLACSFRCSRLYLADKCERNMTVLVDGVECRPTHV